MQKLTRRKLTSQQINPEQLLRLFYSSGFFQINIYQI